MNNWTALRLVFAFIFVGASVVIYITVPLGWAIFEIIGLLVMYYIMHRGLPKK